MMYQDKRVEEMGNYGSKLHPFFFTHLQTLKRRGINSELLICINLSIANIIFSVESTPRLEKIRV